MPLVWGEAIRRAAPGDKEVKTVRMKMLEKRRAALDGVNFVELAEGELYDVPEFLAESYLGRGIAEEAPADAELAEALPDPEASGGGPAEEPALEDLSKLSKADLDALAAREGIDGYPGGRRVKVADKVAAIEAARAAAAPDVEVENTGEKAAEEES